MNPDSSAQGVWFPSWAEALAQARIRDFDRRIYRLAIFEYLRYCKHSRQRATVASARSFMPQVEARRRLTISQPVSWKAALNWFFQSAKSPLLNPPMPVSFQAAKPCSRDKEPPLAAKDLGGPPWEQKLIRELRTRHYEWRTEQAYRMWARRFAAWLAERGQTLPAPARLNSVIFCPIWRPASGRPWPRSGKP